MRTIWALVFFATWLSLAGPGEPSGPLFVDLEGIPRHPLDPAEKVASVLFFYCQDCPISNGYAPEINRICASYTNFEFFIVQVDPDLTPAAAREHAREYELRAPILLDPQHRLVKLAKAKATPEAVVLGRNGQMLYRGRIDDLHAALGKKRGTATQHDLREALDTLAAGKKLKPKETKAIGCLIQ